MDYVEMLRQFHAKYGHAKLYRPGFPDENTQDLRYRLIDEEVNDELLELLSTCEPTNDDDKIQYLVELADALADSLYVIFGAALAYGIPIDEIFAEVHRSNMTKSTEKNEYGKSVKGKNFEMPKIREILERYAKS